MSSTEGKERRPCGTSGVWSVTLIAILIILLPSIASAGSYYDEAETVSESDLPDQLIVRDFRLMNDQMFTGNSLVATVLMVNDGTTAVNYDLPMEIDGDVASTISGTIRAGDTDTLTFSVQVNEPGVYEASLPESGETAEFEVRPGWPTRNFGSDNNPIAEFLEGPESEVLRPNWEYETGGSIQAAPVYADGTLFFGSNNNQIYAVDSQTGDERWTFPAGETVRISPVLIAGQVVAANQDGIIFALDMETGEQNWRVDAGATIWGSPTTEGELIYFGLRDIDTGEGNGILVLDAESGEQVARFPGEGVIVNTPAISDGVLYTGTSGDQFFSVDTERKTVSFEQRLNWIFDGEQSFLNAPTVADGIAFVAEDNLSMASHFYAIDIENGEELWSRTFDPGRVSSATVDEGVLYIGSNGGTFYALEAETGEEIWSLTPDTDFSDISFGTASPIITDGKITLHTTTPGGASNKDRIYILNQEDGTVLSVYDDLPNITTEPIMADGQLFFGTRGGQATSLTALRGADEDDFIPDPAASTLTATTPHWAVGDDPSEVTINVVNAEGEPLTDLENDDFNVLIDGDASAGEVTESFTDGEYTFEVTGLSEGIVRVSAEVVGIPLETEAEIEFLDAETDWERIEITELQPFHVITSVHFINEEEGWIVASPEDIPGEDTIILKTDDGGESWESMFETDVFINDIFFTDSETGWIIGVNGFLQATQDGGETWEEQDLDFGSTLNSIYFTDSDYGWIASDNNLLYRTMDGGDNWEPTDPAEGNTLTDVFFIDRETGWYSQNSQPGIFRSDDGGETWDAQGGDLFFFGLDFEDEQTGRAAGPNGLIGLTNDGGTTWEPVNSEAGQNLLAIAFQDEERGWSVGQNRTLIQTEDGGETWNPVFASMPEFTNLLDIQFIGDDFGWASGSQATLLRYDNREEDTGPIVDAAASSAEATSPHDADGEDASVLTVEVVDESGEPINGLGQEDIVVQSEFNLSSGSFTEREEAGIYEIELTSEQPFQTTLFVRVLGVLLDDNPRVEFREPEDDPVVDAEASIIEATSPHLADGEDESELTLTLLFEDGEPVEGLNEEDIELTIDGPGELSGFEESDEGVYLYSVTSDDPGTATISVAVLGVDLSDTATIEFEDPVDDVVPVPLLIMVSDTQNGPEIAWEVDQTANVNGFAIYRSSGVNDFQEIGRADASDRSFIDSGSVGGSVFYSVAALDRAEQPGELSLPLSFVRTTISATEEWQLISAPVEEAVTATDRASIFAFTDRYEDRSELNGTEGYWIKTRTFDDEEFDLTGAGLDSVTVQLNEGWNLIGSLSENVPVAMIDDPEGILDDSRFYIFGETGYEPTEEIVSGNGHWVFTADEGEVEMSVFTQLEMYGDQRETISGTGLSVEDAESPRLQFSSAGETRYLSIAAAPLNRSEQIAAKLPPLAPDPSLDIRTTDHLGVIRDSGSEVNLTSGNYPVEVRLTGAGESDRAYRLTLERSGEKRTVDVTADSPGVIDDEYDRIYIEQIDASEMIAGHELKENYPNPFNPATTIRYTVGEQVHVQIEVYDSIGRRVQTLTSEVQEAGEYRVTFDVNHLASGVYMVRFQAGDVTATHQMTLIK